MAFLVLSKFEKCSLIIGKKYHNNYYFYIYYEKRQFLGLNQFFM